MCVINIKLVELLGASCMYAVSFILHLLQLLDLQRRNEFKAYKLPLTYTYTQTQIHKEAPNYLWLIFFYVGTLNWMLFFLD